MMSRFRTTWLAFAAPAILVGSAFFAGCSQTGESFNVERKTVNGLPTVIAKGSSWATVKVDAIDYDKRSIAITDTDGKQEIFTLGPEVKNFTQIKKGDNVRVEYANELTAEVYKVNEEPMMDMTEGFKTADLGDKPGLLAYRKVKSQMNVTAIDHKTRVVTLKGPAGGELTLTVNPKVKNLDKVNVGDQVIFKYVEALTINVTTP